MKKISKDDAGQGTFPQVAGRPSPPLREEEGSLVENVEKIQHTHQNYSEKKKSLLEKE